MMDPMDPAPRPIQPRPPVGIPGRNIGFGRALFSAFTWRLAWRDSRSSRRRLLLFATSIVIGIAALVAIRSFGESLRRAIDEQARGLLGADLSLGGRQPFDGRTDALLARIGGEVAMEVDVMTMAVFPQSGQSRLVDLRAFGTGYPFYGELETDPPAAAAAFRRGEGALVEETLLAQMNAGPGDGIRVGSLTTTVLGRLRKVPGEATGFSAFAPRVLVNRGLFDQAGLLRTGSLARYKAHFRLPAQSDPDALVARLRPELNELKLGASTVETKKNDLGRFVDRVTQYLSLVGFVALLLGGVGMASAIHVHLQQKIESVATLRCLGCSVGQTFAIYLLQGTALGAAGALAGALVGVAVQAALPHLFAGYLTFPVPVFIAWGAVVAAMAQGFIICVLFALLPLLAVRRVSPLAALRVSYETNAARRDPARWLAAAALAGSVIGFCILNSRRWQMGLGFAGGLAVAFAALGLLARGLVWAVRRSMRPSWPFLLRQGLANLHRPNNRTVLLLLALGLGTFLMLTLYLVQNNILREIASSRPTTEANVILFDVQSDQRDGAKAVLAARGLPLLDEAPIITLRLSAIQGTPVSQILGVTNRTIPNWVLRREYRSSIAGALRPGETIVAGEWPPSTNAAHGAVGVSMEDGLARDMGVGLGARLEFDVQGVPIEAVVTSLRNVDWRRVQPGFFLLFPPDTLRDAPATHILTTRAPTPVDSAALQSEIVRQFSNISVIDVSVLLRTLDAIVDKVAFVIRFMALFTIATGLLVLAGAVLTGRYQRIRESILLRTLGASRRQVLGILLVEYLSLGTLAALAGIGLSVAASWALAFWVFEIPFIPDFTVLALTVVAVAVLTTAVGLFASRGVLNHPPLEILRSTGT
jgi:putative ABC transport system permease protein